MISQTHLKFKLKLLLFFINYFYISLPLPSNDPFLKGANTSMVLPYFDRVYMPSELTFFDEVLATEFISPMQAHSFAPSSSSSVLVGRRKAQFIGGAGASGVVTFGPALVDEEEDSRQLLAQQGVQAQSSLSSQGKTGSLPKPVLLTGGTAFVSSPYTEIGSINKGERSNSHYEQQQGPGSAGGTGGNNRARFASDHASSASQGEQGLLQGGGGGNRGRFATEPDPQSVFGLGRYVREIGIKARTLVGGMGNFMRKEESAGLVSSRLFYQLSSSSSFFLSILIIFFFYYNFMILFLGGVSKRSQRPQEVWLRVQVRSGIPIFVSSRPAGESVKTLCRLFETCRLFFWSSILK